MLVAHIVLAMGMTVDTGKASNAAAVMALGTRESVITGQREGMPIARRRPGRGRVARRAIQREVEGGMVLGALVIGTVTGGAIRGEPGIGTAGMTLAAIQSGMAAGQGKCRMIKRGRGPGGGTVTFLTTM